MPVRFPHPSGLRGKKRPAVIVQSDSYAMLVIPMSAAPQNKTDPSEETGVADVRLVREKIAAQYQGDLRHHIAETDQIVEPLIEKLGLKQGVPPRQDNRHSGTEG